MEPAASILPCWAGANASVVIRSAVSSSAATRDHVTIEAFSRLQSDTEPAAVPTATRSPNFCGSQASAVTSSPSLATHDPDGAQNEVLSLRYDNARLCSSLRSAVVHCCWDWQAFYRQRTVMIPDLIHQGKHSQCFRNEATRFLEDSPLTRQELNECALLCPLRTPRPE